MRSGPNSRRPMRRGSGGGGGGRRGGSPRSQNFDSSGPDIKVRGTAQQVIDKYQSLAREAATAGDPVMAENYYQHAEHYFRVLSANGGGDNNRHNGRQPDADRSQNTDQPEAQQSAGNGSDQGEETTAATSSEQPGEDRRNGQNGRRRSQPASHDDEAESGTPPATASSPEETSEPAT